jgi:hypothetical protein
VLVITFAACAAPPNREIADAQAAIKAAKAAGAETYASGPYTAAAEAYRLANEAVMAGDYRLALNRALESREHAQAAARGATDGRVAARDKARRQHAETSTELLRITAQLDAAEKARSLSRTVLRDVRQALSLINADVQKAGAALNREDYAAAQDVLRNAKARLDAVSGDIELAGRTQRARRPTS